jgi:hypothetical protein
MEVEFSLTVDDLQAFLRYHCGKGAQQRHLLGYVLGGFLGVLVLLAVVGGAPWPPWLTREVCWGLFAGALAMLALLAFAGQRNTAQAIQRYFEGNPRLFARHRLALLPEGVRFVSPFAEALVRWPGVLRVAVTDEHLFLYTGTDDAHVVPRRVFADPRDFDAYVAQAESYLEGHTTARFTDAQRPSTDHIHAPEERFDDRRSPRH